MTHAAQGRARPSLAKLYNWRYRDLGDLPAVSSAPAFVAANPGFALDYQLIDVPDYGGRGESCPLPYFYQNLGEAEYLVSVYQYMRLLGYPAHKISVLTTYNGQKALLRDVFERRCAHHPAFGRPAKVGRAGPAALLPAWINCRPPGFSRAVLCLCGSMLAPWACVPRGPPLWCSPSGHHRGQVPGPAERLRAAVPGAHQPLWAPARRAEAG
jgi:hypothetical protein